MKSFTKYLNEIKQADIEQHAIQDKIDDAQEGDFESYAFNHIFGNKLRIVIPMDDKQKYSVNENQIEFALEKEGFVDIDFEKGTANKKVQTKQGEKIQKVKLGKILKSLSKKDSFWQEALHWWELKSDKTKEMGDATGVSIVISRSPIDIIRMSDHSEWHSCHAPPGHTGYNSSYWPCSGQEARTGGAIAYVVRNSDLSKIKNIQAPEIFKDKNRKIDGIEPLERLRLRRFTAYVKDKKTEMDILVPEDSVYGIRHVGFYERVLNWAKKIQEPYVDFNKPPDWKNVHLRGGTYQDTSADKLWNKFFPKANASGNKKSADEKEQIEYGGDNADSMQERAEKQIQIRHFKYVSVQAQAEEFDGRAYLFVNASITFSFPKEDFINIPNEEDGRIRYKKNENNPTLGEIIRNHIENEIYFENGEDIYIGSYGKTVDFVIPLDIYDSGYAQNDNDQLEHFLDYAERDLETSYPKYWGIIRDVLINEGYLKDNWGWNELKNFRIEKNDEFKYKSYYAWITSNEMWIGDLQGIDPKSFPDNPLITENITDIFPKFKFLKKEHIKLSSRKGIGNKDYVFLRISLEFNAVDNKKYFNAFKHIDNYWNQYNQRASAWWNSVKLKLMGQQPQNTKIPKLEKQPQLPQYKQLNLPFKDWLVMSDLPVF